ncbi:MAG: MFS transporter, partial [Eudoraea sp.]|nr:MFS transporter [Eudoraea sp.]
QAIALVLGGLVLKMVGFISDAETQSLETMTNLRIADIIIPAATAAIAILIMWKYSLNEERAREIKRQLVERRGEL